MTFTPGMMPQRKPDHSLRANPEHPLTGEGFTLSGHAAQQARAKGWTPEQVADAANNHEVAYENGRYPGQMRHIKGDIVAVVHPESRKIVTVYKNVQETELRADQTDADARRYNARRMG